MTLQMIAGCVTLACLPISAGCAVWCCLMVYQLRRYEMLLQNICVDAFLARHMPIWIPWSEWSGIGFRLEPVVRREGNGKKDQHQGSRR